MSFLLNPYISGATPSELAVWDAGLLACYTGSGQTFAEKSGNTSYNLYLGGQGLSESSDPHFSGTAGGDSTDEYFSSDGGDVFQLQTTTGSSFLQGLHKANAEFSFYFFGRTPPSSLWGIFANGVTGIECISLAIDSSGNPRFSVANATTRYTVHTATGITVGTSQECMIALSYNEASGDGLFYHKTSAGVKTTESFSKRYSAIPMTPSTGGTGRFEFGYDHQTGLGVWRLRRAGLIQGAATEAQLDALWDSYHARKLA